MGESTETLSDNRKAGDFFLEWKTGRDRVKP